ncbi:MAG: hydrogenase 3 maturation endopeptidase HyCI [Candidatus Micrarchaeia archaeon]
MKFEKLVRGRVVFIGVGNELRGDDGVGVYIARKLRKKNVINAGVAPENFIGKIKRMQPERIVIFDALDFGGKPGEVRVVDARKTEGIKISTHSLPLSFFCKLFDGVEVYLVGIQPKEREFGASLSKEVVRSADRLIAELAVSS